MIRKRKVPSQVLTVVAAALAFLVEGEIGVDLVTCSLSPVSGRGEIDESDKLGGVASMEFSDLKRGHGSAIHADPVLVRSALHRKALRYLPAPP